MVEPVLGGEQAGGEQAAYESVTSDHVGVAHLEVHAGVGIAQTAQILGGGGDGVKLDADVEARVEESLPAQRGPIGMPTR